MQGRAVQLACTWAGILGFVVFFIGFVPLSRFLPPPAPSLPSEAVKALYEGNLIPIRLGQVLIGWGGALQGVWCAQAAAMMKRMEGEDSPLTYAMLVVSAIAFTVFIGGSVALTTAAYRPERAIEITQAIHDMGWFWYMMPAMPFTMICLLMGFAVLNDRNSPPVLPRWIGYFSLWCGVLQAPGSLVGLFKTGPFAWNGAISFYMALAGFGGWMLVSSWAMLRALRTPKLDFAPSKA
jgi:hypothetical protein